MTNRDPTHTLHPTRPERPLATLSTCFLLTQNSELDPVLVPVLPIKSNTGVETTVFCGHSADDQRAIGLRLVPGDQTQSLGFDPHGG